MIQNVDAADEFSAGWRAAVEFSAGPARRLRIGLTGVLVVNHWWAAKRRSIDGGRCLCCSERSR